MHCVNVSGLQVPNVPPRLSVKSHSQVPAQDVTMMEEAGEPLRAAVTGLTLSGLPSRTEAKADIVSG